MHVREIRTFREPLYACGMEPSCGAAVPASTRPQHEAWHQDWELLQSAVADLRRVLTEPTEALEAVEETDVPISPWHESIPQPHEEPATPKPQDPEPDHADLPADDDDPFVRFAGR